MKTYDCFTFFNELDLLEMRMNILNDVVDYFVIVESTVTFSSKQKKLFFQENKERYSEFLEKIIHVVVDDTPNNFFNINFDLNQSNKMDLIKHKILKHVDESTGWGRHETQWGVETYQRECIMRGLIDCNENDLILISDLDEIPNPNEIKKIKLENNKENIYEFKQNMYCYFINCLKEQNWSGTKALYFNNLENKSINHIRQNKYTNNIIQNGGWHFSFFGGAEKVKEKIEAYSHQEYNSDYYKNAIQNNINNNIDPFFRGTLTIVDIDDTFPNYLLNNKEKFINLIK